jgi:cell division inhibitor SepF
MGIFSNFMDKMRITNDDDEYYDDDDEYVSSKPSKSGIFSRKSPDYEEDEEEYDPPKPSLFSSRNKSSNITPVKKPMEVSLIRPQNVDDARVICDLLLEGKAVVLNMEGLHTEIAQRIIDYTSGATYSIDGKLQKISNYIFIATPVTVELSGEFQDLMMSGGFDDSGLNIRV